MAHMWKGLQHDQSRRYGLARCALWDVSSPELKSVTFSRKMSLKRVQVQQKLGWFPRNFLEQIDTLNRFKAARLYSFPDDRLANAGTTPNQNALLNRHIHSIKQSTIVISHYWG